VVAHIARATILYEATRFGGDFGLSFATGLQANGCHVTWAKRDEPFPTNVDLLLVYGPFTRSSSMLPAARRLAALLRHTRPLFAWWLTEGIPDPLKHFARAPRFRRAAFFVGGCEPDSRVSEPIQDTEPFEAGRHLVVAPIAQLAERVAYYLQNETERAQIAANAHHLVTQELTIQNTVARILQQTERRATERTQLQA
jgi:hypothetical protein